MITGLTHTMLFVSDYDKAIDFYTQKLGLQLRSNMDLGGGMRWVSVGSPSQPNIDIVLAKPLVYGLIDEETATSLRKAVDKNAMGGGVFATDDCRKTYEELRGKGVEFVSPPQE
jgi:catechol 2,3-dioxygenase-like lactoylglutathione lyase family enzyme